jgi:creatinine amidohydrolase
MTARHWTDLRAPDFTALNPQSVAILPVAAVEQHGPHLPVGTDTLIAQGLLTEVCTLCPEDLHLLILPLQTIGKSNEHLWARGTLTLTAETALKAWTEIGLSIARAGIQKLIIVNSHGGNADLISIIARELRVQANMQVLRLGWTALGLPENLYSERETSFGIHGGDYETSLLLHFRPATVDMTQARDFPSTAETAPLSPIGPIALGWISSDLNLQGVVGEAHLASAEKGRATANHLARAFLTLASQLQEMPLTGFAPSDHNPSL